MFKITNLILIKIMEYFIVEKSYNLVVTKTNENEVYLESLDKDSNQIIYISDKQHMDSNSIKYDIEKVEAIVREIKKKTFKLKLEVVMIYTSSLPEYEKENYKENKIFDMESFAFKNKEIFSDFPELEQVIKITEKELEDKDIISKHMKKIYWFSKHNNINKKTNNIKPQNANNIFLMFLVALNIGILYLPALINLFPLSSKIDIINFAGASSFEMVFINGQIWRPLISGFISYSIISVLIGIYIYRICGEIIYRMYGFWEYFIIILASSFLVQTMSALLIPGHLIFGLDPLLGITLGAGIQFAISNRIEYIKKYSQIIRLNFFLVIITMIFGNKYKVAMLVIAMTIGFVSSFLIKSLKTKKWFDFTAMLLVITTLLAFISFGWRKLPVRYNALKTFSPTFFRTFDEAGIDSNKYKNNICVFYGKPINDCLITKK